jgi:RNA recognition motif-containing protein
MAGKEENRIFVGGLSWNVTERQLHHAFEPFGKIVECQVPFLLISFRDLFLFSVWFCENKGNRKYRILNFSLVCNCGQVVLISMISLHYCSFYMFVKSFFFLVTCKT